MLTLTFTVHRAMMMSKAKRYQSRLGEYGVQQNPIYLCVRHMSTYVECGMWIVIELSYSEQCVRVKIIWKYEVGTLKTEKSPESDAIIF